MNNFERINVTDYISKFVKIPEFFLMDIIQATPKSGNISFFELIAINTLVKFLGKGTFLEFGTFDGRTTTNIAANADSVDTVYTVDLPPENKFKTKLPIADGKHEVDDELGFIGHQDKIFNHPPFNLSIKQLWYDTAEFPVDQFLNKVDFMFIDASHSYQYCMNDSIKGHLIVKDGGFIAWHDYNGWPGVTKALHDFAPTCPSMEFFWLHDTSIVIAKNIKKGG